MSKNYCAEQYEDAFNPRTLQWFGPTKDLPDHAKHRTAPSRFIANDRGHLNERQDRHPGRNPFGNFVGNWDTPCHHPGNHVDNVINRSKPGIQYLQKQRDLYNAAISANEAKNDRVTAAALKKEAGIS
nr:unnamed protein product [Spirometra erinaceieuropaei]